MTRPLRASLALGATLLAAAIYTGAAEQYQARQYTYAWPFIEEGDMRPRGGSTSGPAVTLDKEPGDAWLALREPGLADKERDRRAILAMAGPYRASFDFIETMGFTPGYTPPRPYQSWGTEYVYVVADEPDFISLQHIMVMVFESADGTVSEPMVMKHWRQDWRYEDRLINVYTGNRTWERRRLGADDVKGTWSQAVYQVDDSPRYEDIGRWLHAGNVSTWASEDTWRPLPRREFSVRDDYDVLAGSNRHTIVPTGWTQESDNLKLVLDAKGEPHAEQPYLAREAGLNRYERISGHDFKPGDHYWQRTAPFWAEVRRAWDTLLEQHAKVRVKQQVEGQKLFEAMFAYAGDIEHSDSFDREAARRFVDSTLARFTVTSGDP
ncbi:DUF6607 family protein [Parahaliea mediterranea]|uniref:DUF1329 domain-containing protein n=1 Tax=Parahaliea mediterranea TaxID=651086 RepID=A0A939DFP4_9GAMM|nr:DUF6607 family protein [Parahaliea mediterranea]MBN7797199.1 hypothetical protein [Parahaliea mediterranea]